MFLAKILLKILAIVVDAVTLAIEIIENLHK